MIESKWFNNVRFGQLKKLLASISVREYQLYCTMKKRYYLKFYLFLFFISISSIANAQYWYESYLSDEGDTSSNSQKFAEIDSFFVYYDSLANDSSYGYKYFERWYSHNKFILDSNGTLEHLIDAASFEMLNETDFNQLSSYTMSTTAISTEECDNPAFFSNWRAEGPMESVEVASLQYGIGRINCVMKSSSGDLYAGSNTGIFKSENGGESWEKLAFRVELPFAPPINSIDIFPPELAVLDIEESYDGSYIFISVGEPFGILQSNPFSLGIFRSDDGGVTWTYLSNFLNTIRSPATGGKGFVRKIITHPSDQLKLWCITSKDLFYSVDGGINWNIIQGFDPESLIYDFDYDVSDPDNTWIISSHRVFRTATAGTSWTDITDKVKPVYPTSIHVQLFNKFGNDRAEILEKIWKNVVLSNPSAGEWHMNSNKPRPGSVFPQRVLEIIPTTTPSSTYTSQRKGNQLASSMKIRKDLSYEIKLHFQPDDFPFPDDCELAIKFANSDFSSTQLIQTITKSNFSSLLSTNGETIALVIPANNKYDYLVLEAVANNQYAGVDPIVLKDIEMKKQPELRRSSTYVDQLTGNYYIVHCSDAGPSFYVSKSSNGGQTFSQHLGKTFGFNTGAQASLFKIQGISIQGQDPYIYCGALHSGFVYTDNGVVKYEEINRSDIHVDIRDIYTRGGDAFYASDGGVTAIDPGTPAKFINGFGLHCSNGFNFDINGENDIKFGHLDFGIFTRHTESDYWSDESTGDGWDAIYGKQNFQYAYAAGSSARLIENNGSYKGLTTFQKQTLPTTKELFHLNSSDELFYISDAGSKVIKDGTTPVTIFDFTMIDPSYTNKLVETIAISEESPEVMWLALRDVYLSQDPSGGSRLFRCLDITATSPVWEAVNVSNIKGGVGSNLGVNWHQAITDIELDENDGNIVYLTLAIKDRVGTDRSIVLRSINAKAAIGSVEFNDFSSGWYSGTGPNWNGMFPFSAYKIKKVKYNSKSLDNIDDPDELFVATMNGLWFRRGAGNWVRYDKSINDGPSGKQKPSLPRGKIQDIEVDYKNGKVYCSVFGNGIWSSGLPCCPKNVEEYKIENYVTWSNSQHTVNQDIRILPGYVLEITNSFVRMAPDVKIIVESGGKLIIDNSILTKKCEELWKGIIVLGDANSQHVLGSLNHGQLEIRNGSEILYALDAITMGDLYGNPFNTSGGICLLKDSKFTNNRHSVSFYPYSYVNISSIENCEFRSNSDLNYSNRAGSGVIVDVKLWGVTTIPIVGCKFINTTKNKLLYQGTTFTGRGVAISALDAPVSVYPGELDPNPPIVEPCGAPSIPNPCYFEGYDIGVQAFTAGSKNTSDIVTIYDADFHNNATAIQISDYSNPTIYDIDVTCDQDFKLNPTINTVRAIHTTGTDELNIIGNRIDFSDLEQLTPTGEYSSLLRLEGIHTNNTFGVETSKVIYNHITSSIPSGSANPEYESVANYLIDDNSQTQILCNIYDFNPVVWEYDNGSSTIIGNQLHDLKDPGNLFNIFPTFVFDPTNINHKDKYHVNQIFDPAGLLFHAPYDDFVTPTTTTYTCDPAGVTYQDVFCPEGSGGGEGSRSSEEKELGNTLLDQYIESFYARDTVNLIASCSSENGDSDDKRIACDLLDALLAGNYSNIGTFKYTGSSSNSSSTGLNHKAVDNYDFRLYPNPTTGLMVLKFASKNQQCKYEIVDQIGNVITTSNNFVGTGSIVLDFTGLSSGLYYVNVMDSFGVRLKSMKAMVIR